MSTNQPHFEAWMTTQNKERLSRGFPAYTGCDASMLMDAWQASREAVEAENAIDEVLRLNSAVVPAKPHSDAARYGLLRARFDDCKSSQCELMQEFLKLDGEPHESLDALIDRALLGKEEN